MHVMTIELIPVVVTIYSSSNDNNVIQVSCILGFATSAPHDDGEKESLCLPLLLQMSAA
jgi:hypothetical protein